MTLEDKLNELLLRQDEYNASVLADIKSDPTKFAQFLNNAQQNILNKTINQHSDLYDKTYSDLQRAADVQKNIYYYYQRNLDVNNMQDSIFKNVVANSNNSDIESNNSKRQFEINEWTTNNRRDTLFVFQIILIGVLLNSVFLALYRYNITGGPFYTFVTFLTLIIIIFIIVNRSNYTDQLRDKRYWNRRTFIKAPPPNIADCPALVNSISNIDDTLGNAADSVFNSLSNTFNAASAAAGAASSAFSNSTSGSS
jgi:hypothetical protein